MRTLVLASTSPYRLQLMRQLGLQFHVTAPLYDEVIEQGVAPELMVKHLAYHKAESLRERYPDALIIGADQLFVDSRHRIIGKPDTFEAAVGQLMDMQGRTHSFYTGVSVYDSARKEAVTEFDIFSVTLRELTEFQVRDYLRREKPLDCAGSFKVEGLGIALMSQLEGNDYTCLIGLPLIKLVDILGQFGVDVFAAE